jgi:predicted  nucleic acid-binding Zn-ribbon protein
MKSLKKNIAISLLVIFALFLFGCGASKSYDTSMGESGSAANQAMTEEAVAPEAPQEASSSFMMEEAYAAQGEVTEQKIIRHADLNLKVNQAQKAVGEIEKKTEQVRGFIASSSQSKNQQDKLRVNMTLRIPAESFTDFMSFLEGLGNVEHRRVYTDDVTQQYIDLSAKVDSLTIQEKRLQEILSKASKIEDLLRIEQEIARVRGEIDSYTGQLRYLTNKVDYSTIELTLQETTIDQEALNLGNIDGTWGRSQRAFISSINQLLHMLSSLVVAGFALLPFLIIPILAVVLVLVFRNKLIKRKDENI